MLARMAGEGPTVGTGREVGGGVETPKAQHIGETSSIYLVIVTIYMKVYIIVVHASSPLRKTDEVGRRCAANSQHVLPLYISRGSKHQNMKEKTTN